MKRIDRVPSIAECDHSAAIVAVGHLPLLFPGRRRLLLPGVAPRVHPSFPKSVFRPELTTLACLEAALAEAGIRNKYDFNIARRLGVAFDRARRRVTK
jgi:hypothetical protein